MSFLFEEKNKSCSSSFSKKHYIESFHHVSFFPFNNCNLLYSSSFLLRDLLFQLLHFVLRHLSSRLFLSQVELGSLQSRIRCAKCIKRFRQSSSQNVITIGQVFHIRNAELCIFDENSHTVVLLLSSFSVCKEKMNKKKREFFFSILFLPIK